MLLYVAFNGVHAGVQAPQSYITKYQNLGVTDSSRRTLCAAVGFLAALTGLGLTGCGYQLSGRRGSGNTLSLPADVHRIAIPVFTNETRRAEIEQRITESLLDEFIKRGGYQTQPQRAGADAVLEGAVTGYNAAPVSLSQTGRAHCSPR